MFDSIIGRIARMEEDIRRLKLRQPQGAPFTQEHGWALGNGIFDSTIVIPGLRMAVNPTGDFPEYKEVIGWDVTAGTSSGLVVQWSVDGGAPAAPSLSPPTPVLDFEMWQPVITAGTGQDISIALYLRVFPGVSERPA